MVRVRCWGTRSDKCLEFLIRRAKRSIIILVIESSCGGMVVDKYLETWLDKVRLCDDQTAA